MYMYIYICIYIYIRVASLVKEEASNNITKREQAPRSRQPCSVCGRRGGRLRGARFVSVANGCEIVTDSRIAVKLLVHLVIMPVRRPGRR